MPTMMTRALFADLVLTIAALASVGMLCTIGIELAFIAARHFGAP